MTPPRGAFASAADDVRRVRLAASRQAPAFPVNVLYPWITLLGSALSCSSCGATSTAPSLRSVPDFNAACERWLEAHKRCSEATA